MELSPKTDTHTHTHTHTHTQTLNTFQSVVILTDKFSSDKLSSGYFPGRLSIKSRRFETLCRFHLQQVVVLKMEPTQCSETSAFNTQTPGKHPEDNVSLLQLNESLKTKFSSVSARIIKK